jgi:hypothetical protein
VFLEPGHPADIENPGDDGRHANYPDEAECARTRASTIRAALTFMWTGERRSFCHNTFLLESSVISTTRSAVTAAQEIILAVSNHVSPVLARKLDTSSQLGICRGIFALKVTGNSPLRTGPKAGILGLRLRFSQPHQTRIRHAPG